MGAAKRDEIPKPILDHINDQATRTPDLESEPLTDLAEKFSGAHLERVALVDGRTFVVKHLPAEGDWLTRATGAPGRVWLLWSSGVLDEVGAVVDHATVGCLQTAAGSVIVMRDVSAQLVPPAVPVPQSISNRLLAGLARLHTVRVTSIAGLCSLGARYRLFSPQFHRSDTGSGQHPMREAIVTGWDRFFEIVPRDVGDAVAQVHRDPDALGLALARFPDVLLHGDAKLENMGLGPDGCVLIDWGDLTGFGPVEVDVAWYALKGASRISVDPDQLFADYETVAGRTFIPEALDLACLGALAQMGFRMANSATFGRPEPQAVGDALLNWWSGRVKSILASCPVDQLLAT